MLTHLSEQKMQDILNACSENDTGLGGRICEALETIETVLEEDG